MTALETATTRSTTLDEVRRLAVIPVHSNREPNYAGLVGIGRSLAYRSAQTGEIPTVRIGGRILVRVPALLALLGGQAETR